MIGRLRDISGFRSVRLLRIACFSVYLVPAAAIAQVVTEQVPVGNGPAAVAVNSVTNQIYVANHDSGRRDRHRRRHRQSYLHRG